MNTGIAAETACLLLAPIGFWAAFHYYHDRHRPEPIRHLLLTYLLGIAAGYLCPYAYAALDWFGLRHDAYELAATNPPALLLYALLVIGVVEEVVKFLPFWLFGMRLSHFDEAIDGIIYASFVALGFATAENIAYLRYMDGWEVVGRAVASPVVHVMFASIWGYFCSRAAMNGRPLLPAAAAGLTLAALVHGLYDFAAIWGSDWVRLLPPVIILAIWLWRMHLIRRLQEQYTKRLH